MLFQKIQCHIMVNEKSAYAIWKKMQGIGTKNLVTNNVIAYEEVGKLEDKGK